MVEGGILFQGEGREMLGSREGKERRLHFLKFIFEPVAFE